MSDNNNPASSGNIASSSDSKSPYTITEQDGKLNVVFTFGPQQGVSFRMDRPPHVGSGEALPAKQVDEEPSHPFSYLDGHGNEIAKEEFERLSMEEIKEEERREREQATRRS